MWGGTYWGATYWGTTYWGVYETLEFDTAVVQQLIMNMEMTL